MQTFVVLFVGALSVAGAVVLPAGSLGRPTHAAACSLIQGTGPRIGPALIPRESPRDGRVRPKGRVGAPAFLHQVADIPLPGRPVRFDYQSEDARSGRLYISHMNDAHIEVFDTRTRQVVTRVAETPGVTGVWVAPELKKLYASVTGDHRVAVLSTNNLRVLATPGPIGFPDGIAYVPGVKRVFVSDESGGGELVIDGVTDQVVARIPLGGEAGNTKYDALSGCVLVAVQTLGQIVTIDPASLQVVGRYRLDGAAHPHGMYADGPDRLLFVANEGNATVEVVDLAALRVTDIVQVGDDPDVLAFDPGPRRLYVATESGGVWVYHVDDERLVADGTLGLSHAHTVSVDPATHLLYLPLQDLGGRPVLRLMVDSSAFATGR